MRISIDVFGDKEVERTLVRFGERANNMRPAFEDLHKRFLQMNKRQFNTQGASGSGGWKALKPATVAFKERNGLDPRIMHASGRLRSSLTGSGQGAIKRVTNDEVFFGTSVEYAGPHQKPKSGNPLPRRKVIEFTETEKREWTKVIQRQIVGRG